MWKPSKSYCAAPFVHMRLRQGAQGWHPCCAWQPAEQDFDVGMDHPDPFNHPDFVRLRQAMLRGDHVSGCVLCNLSERDGVPKLRDEFDERYGYRTEPELDYLEVTFGNLCNLRCRTCNSGASTRWIADEIRMGMQPHGVISRDASDIRVPLAGLRRLRVSGGEPLMEQHKLVSLLERIADAQGGLSDVWFEMVSNGTLDMTPRLAELVGMFGHVFLQTSLDGVGAVNDYQRTGSRFDDIANRVRLYDGMASDRFEHWIAYSVGILNIGGFTELVDWVGDELINTQICIQPVYHPEWQALRNLPPNAKEMVQRHLDGWIPTVRCRGYEYGVKIERLLWAECDLPVGEIVAGIARLDAITGDSFADVDPRMHAALLAALNH